MTQPNFVVLSLTSATAAVDGKIPFADQTWATFFFVFDELIVELANFPLTTYETAKVFFTQDLKNDMPALIEVR